MSERRSNLLIPISLLLVAGAGGYGAYYFYQQQQGARLDTVAEHVKFVPPTAVAGLAVSANLGHWQSLERFQTQELQEAFADVPKNFLSSDLDIDFARDIQPWLGAVFVGILPPPGQQALHPTVVFTQDQSSPSVGITGSFIVVMGVRNRNKAEKFLQEKVIAKLQQPPQKAEYKGSKLFITTDGVWAFADRYLLFANDRQSLEEGIDTYQGGKSFTLPPIELSLNRPLLHFYIPDLKRAIALAAKTTPQTIPQPFLERIEEQAKAMVIGLGVEDTGLRLQAVTQLGTKAPKFQPAPGKVIAHFPADTYFLFSGINFKQAWQNLLEQAKTEKTQQEAIDEIRQGVKDNLNLDLDKDIIAWMDGEFALGVIPSEEGILKQTRSGLVAVIQTSDRKTAETTLKRVDELTQELGFPVKVTSQEINGVQVQEWTSPFTPGSILAYGWHQPDSLFVAMGPLAKVMTQKPSPSLADSAAFKAIAGQLDSQNQGYLYLNLAKLWSIYAQDVISRVPPTEAKQTQAVMNSINGMAVAYSQPSSEQAKLELFLSLRTK
ncbi:MAG: DUF3352 domain-containing protein [Pseudanabaenaceae cyanobacterium SKYGB_i_bin29]|nr:DUF3352 domain-containing protein [Pseudanabaenaceae cyanobacterium SKYG29]MDW8421560.1 DUF3352 domain-containing protein [Pseudanabaenaceae cyanobacterium SKYGB_i_bin29]